MERFSDRPVAVVGIGSTPFYKRGRSHPRTILEMSCAAIVAACEDAGLPVSALDGFAYFSGAVAGYTETLDTATFMETLGIPEIGFSAAVTSGGGGSAGSVGLARAALLAGDANYVVTVMALQQSTTRLGSLYTGPASPIDSFVQPSGAFGPGQLMALMVRRHMHRYGTRRDAFCEVAITHRNHAQGRPDALMQKPLTRDDYFSARMIADPLCLYDFCLESDGAVAVITTTLERARDLRQPPVPVLAAATGGGRDWGRCFSWQGMPEETYTSAGMAPIARRLYAQAGLGPHDVDVACLYDHFTAMVCLQLEDFGFCPKGEGGPFVESGAIRVDGGSIPVNPHGGQLSHAYLLGMTQIVEATEQMRGTAHRQVAGAEVALVSGGPSHLPVSGLLLGRDQ